MISSIRKRPTYILYSILLALVTSCATIPNGSKNWAENTLKKLSLREKIGQMLIYRMSMRLKDIPSSKWKEIVDLIDSDGLGGVHLWYGEASSSLTIMNECRIDRVFLFFLMLILNMVCISDFQRGPTYYL